MKRAEVRQLIYTSLRRGPLIWSKSLISTAATLRTVLFFRARTTPRLERCADLRHAEFTAVVEVSVLDTLEKF